MRRTILFCLLIFSLCFADDEYPPGHLQPLGSHMAPLPVDVREDFIDPIEFFEHYVKPSKPVLMKGLAKTFPSFDLLRNDQYLKESYGDWNINAEKGKKETRSGSLLKMSYAEFLDTYNHSDIYLIADVEPSHPLAKDVYIPKCMLCGGYTEMIINSVMWFSSGGTKSVLHNDDLENINCLYDGVKELAMFDKKHDDLVPIDMIDGHYSSVDVDRVDMYKYPTLSKAPWHKATMEAGDCFYIPYKWHHQVNSSRTRNLAINLWWAHLQVLPERENCPDDMAELPPYIPLSSIKLASEAAQLRPYLLQLLHPTTKTLKIPSLINFFKKSLPNTSIIKAIQDFFDQMDENKDGLMSLSEVHAFTEGDFERLHNFLIASEDITEEGEDGVEVEDLHGYSVPPGHLKPLGSHMEPLSIEVLDYWPDPIQFFNDYLKPGKPVKFRGTAKSYPGYNNWRDDNYLKLKYGKWKVEAEEGKKENRSQELHSMTFHQFLERYKDSDIYLVSDVEPSNPMAEELFLPKPLLCGGYTDVLATVVMWFSSGGTKSVLHNDGLDNINCIYDGSKDIVLIDKKYEDLVPIDMKDGGYSSVDIDSVDMHKYPTLQKLPWHKATITAGDCIFIPFKWFHQVNSMGSRNLAINVWWSHLQELPDKASCPDDMSEVVNYSALSNHKFFNEFQTPENALVNFYTKGIGDLSLKYLEELINHGGITPTHNKSLKEFFTELDTDDNGLLSLDEAKAASPETLLAFFGKSFADEQSQDLEEEPEPKDEL